jgi:hypothetical protein
MFVLQGILEDKPDALKSRVGYDYNNQLAFIEGIIPLNPNPNPNPSSNPISGCLTFRNASSYDS